MKKIILGILSILLILSCVGCKADPEQTKSNMLLDINNKYNINYTEADIISTNEADKSTTYYFGKKTDMFDDSDIFVVLYDHGHKLYFDNYNACILENEIVERATKATEKECFVYVNTASYPISFNKYTDLNTYMIENEGTISFNVFICDTDNTVNIDTLKQSYMSEFANMKGTVNVEILNEDIYQSIRNKDYETFNGHSDEDKLYVGVIEW